MLGGWLSVTVILNEHEALLPDGSTALHATEVTPTGKVVVPNKGHVTTALPLESVAVALLQTATPVDAPDDVLTAIFDGQVITGGTTSTMTTLNEQPARLLDVSVAVHVTLVLPNAKDEPETGVQDTDFTATLSVATAAGYATTVRDWPCIGDTMVVLGHVITGGVTSATVILKEQEL